MRRRFRPSIESLENREVFSANAFQLGPTVVEQPQTDSLKNVLISSYQDGTSSQLVRSTTQASPAPQPNGIIAVLIGL
ncbi:MAG: hypothetical protein U0795_20005 [Pirellulales bacterium]